MSLYTDDNSLVQSSVPTQTDDTSPLDALSTALTQPAESAAQAQALATALERFEAEPSKIPEIAAQLLPMVLEGGDSLLRTWTLDLVLLAVGRADLRLDVKVAVAQKSLLVLVQLLHPPVPNPKTLRQLIPIFSTIYPLLFRAWATTRTHTDPQIVQALQLSKRTILSIVQAPKGAGVSRGVMAVAWKFVQRILLVGTRNGGADPRLQSKTDPNVNLWPASNTTLNPAELEQEALRLRETLVTCLFTYDDPALLHPLLNMIPPLAKARPSLAPLLISSVTQWTPAALEAAGRPASQIRAVEKTVKVAMVHLSRFQPLSAFAMQLAEGIAAQRKRLEQADLIARQQRPGTGRKRELSPVSMNQHAETSAAGAKRMKMEDVPPAGVGSGTGKGVEFDVSHFRPEIVIDLVMRNFQALRPEVIERAFSFARRAIETNSPDAMPVLAPSLGFAPPGSHAAFATFGADEGPDDMLMDGSGHALPAKPDAKPDAAEEEEAMNPLDMESDDEEEFGDLDLAAYADLTNAEASSSAVAFADFSLPAPKATSPEVRDEMIHSAIMRIWQSGAELASGISSVSIESTYPGVSSAVKPRELWMLLVSRLTTRGKMPVDGAGVAGAERLQQMTCDFIAADFAKRSKFASVWLNEEWFNAKMAGSASTVYTSYLDSILKTQITRVDNKDSTLSGFLNSLPEIPQTVLSQLGSLCLDHDKMIIGFTALREIIEARPPMRDEAMKIALPLTTHSDRRIRVAAINNVRRWQPDVEPMNTTVTEYAKALLARFFDIKPAPPAPKVEEAAKAEPAPKTELEEHGGAADMETDEQKPQAEPEPEPEPEIALGTEMSPYLPTELVAPVPESTVQQHLELLFALCKRQPEHLHDIFNAYPKMEPGIQESLGTLLAPLISSMGSGHPKLLEILRNFPIGADKLALRILTVLTDTKRRPDPSLVKMVKELMEERELDPRFIIPILGDLEKAEVMKQLPRLVQLLCGGNKERDLVRKVFSSVVFIPDAFTLASNQPRTNKKDMMTPADLLVLLLEEEKTIGIKATIEAIGICFSMTEVFKSEVLAVVMQRVVDLPELPVVFLRTVIQAVNTYRSLVGFVANTVLPRLIAKKVWLNDKLWGGFILCAKLIAPASFGALLQLPREQIKDLVNKQPTLKPGLRAFMASKPGVAKTQALNEIFGEPEPALVPKSEASPSPAPSQTVTVN